MRPLVRMIKMTEEIKGDKNQLPKDWKWVKLGEVCDKISLNKIKIKQKDYLEEGTYPVVDQGQDLIGGYYNDKNLLIPNEPPYIIFGGHTKAKKYINFKFIAGADGVKVLKAKDVIDSKFLYYSLFTIKIEDKGYARHFQLLEKELFPLPPKPIQQAIVSKIEELFSELDKGIENLRTAQQQLKTYRQSVLKWAFEGKLTNENVKEGELPEGWKWIKLGEVSKVSGGLTKNAKRQNLELQLPFLRVANVYFNYLDLIEIHTIGINKSEIERVRLEKDDLLFVEGNGSIEQIGRVALWNGAIENCVHQNHLIKSRLSKQFVPKYALYFFCSKIGRDRIKEQANSTSGLHTLSLGKISKLELPLCLIKEQHSIVQAIEGRLSVADKMEESITQSLQQAEALRQSILKKAFEGRLV
jgi:type I restriction enzyme S subunit